MSQPRRFKAALSPEGRLLMLGSEEVPAPEVKQRVMRQLGISATAIASAAATTAMVPSTNAAAVTSAAKGVGSLAAEFAGTTTSFVATTVAKATVIGLIFGVTSYAGVKLYTSVSSSTSPHVSAAKILPANPPPPKAATFHVASAASASQFPIPVTSSAKPGATSSGNAGGAIITPAPAQSTNALLPGARPVARFDDVESPAVLPSSVPTTTTSLARLGLLQNTRAMPPASAFPLDPRLAREVASLDRARASANRGDAADAVRELTGFERSYGYVSLRKEAMLVHVDVLLSLGRQVEAAAIARQLLLAGPPATRRAKLEELVRSQP